MCVTETSGRSTTRHVVSVFGAVFSAVGTRPSLNHFRAVAVVAVAVVAAHQLPRLTGCDDLSQVLPPPVNRQ